MELVWHCLRAPILSGEGISLPELPSIILSTGTRDIKHLALPAVPPSSGVLNQYAFQSLGSVVASCLICRVYT